jgi:acid phosphatase
MKSRNHIYISFITYCFILSFYVSSEEPVVNKTLQEQSLLAVLYAQTSTEYVANCMQTYANATSAIDRALADSSWTAAQEQTGKFSEKSPAIIIDVDETVLDNIAFQARSILTGISYPTGWIEWGLEESAEPVPGVSNFLKHAHNKGVKIFYVTNRVVELQEATKNNLKLLGLPFDEDRDVLLMRGENGWGSSKVSRRALVAKDYRVILLVGDQLGDFISLEESTLDSQSRRKLAEKYSDMWGTKWFMLTNPMYGRWESSIYGNKYPDTKEEQMQMRIKALKP